MLESVNDLIISDNMDEVNIASETMSSFFIALLGRPSNIEREVRAYAEQLLVTPKYLNAVCKEKSGRTAIEWITENTVRHIKYYLMQTNLTVKEIAFKLDFPDVSFFCKYVKKHLGMAPLEYRSTQLISNG